MHSRSIGSFGAKGAGKSHLLKLRARAHPRVIAFLPVPLDRLPNAMERRALADVRRELLKNYDRHFAIVWRPPLALLPEALSALSEIILDVQRATGARHELCLYADELQLAFPEEKLPAHARGFVSMSLTSRHYRIQLLGAGQRLAGVSKHFTGNLDEIYILRPSEVPDTQRARALLGDEWTAAIKSLRNKDHIHKDNTTGRVIHHRHNGR
jgi:hypothetical protein